MPTMDTWKALQAAGTIILSVVAPRTWRLTRLKVHDSAYAPTAFTDGVNVVLPHTFSGIEVAEDLPLALGLLTHELGHFLQPLKAIAQVEKETGLDHGLINVALDIQGEALMASLFPLNAESVAHCRQICWDAHQADYEKILTQAQTLADGLGGLLMTGRFSISRLPWAAQGHLAPFAWRAEARKLSSLLDDLTTCPPQELPDRLRSIASAFPQLCHQPPPPPPAGSGAGNGAPEEDDAEAGDGDETEDDQEDNGAGGGGQEQPDGNEQDDAGGQGDDQEEDDEAEGDEEQEGAAGQGDDPEEEDADEGQEGDAGDAAQDPEGQDPDGGNGAVREPGVSADDLAAEAVQAEAQQQVGYSVPESVDAIKQHNFTRQPMAIEEQILARSLRVRFKAERGAFQIAAPGRVVRRLVGLGDPMPMRLDIPGRETPAPAVVICLDVSESMDHAPKYDQPKKSVIANVAVRVLALGIQQVGGKIVGLQFGSHARGDRLWGADPLFSNTGGIDGSTDFTFLTEAWRRWENYWFLLVTDGSGNPPAFIPPGDRERTSCLVIPYGDLDNAKVLAAHVQELTDVKALPQVLPLLVPPAMR